MLYNIISVAALAALASAAPYATSSETPYGYNGASTSTTLATAASSTKAGESGSTSTVTKTVSICTSAVVGTGAGSKSTAAAATGAKNLDPVLAGQLAVKMHSEVTAVDKFKDLLTDNGTLLSQSQIQDRIVFDFNAAPKTNATGGRILVANQKNFPALTDLGIAGAVAFLEPCSMNTPHIHPRATELLTVVQGRLHTGMMLENTFAPTKGGLTTEIMAELTQFQSTVFPQGSIHFQFNPTCDNAIFVAALSSSDPGTSQIAQNFFFEEESIVKITMGESSEVGKLDIEKVRSQIPANLVQAIDTCTATCKAQGKL